MAMYELHENAMSTPCAEKLKNVNRCWSKTQKQQCQGKHPLQTICWECLPL